MEWKSTPERQRGSDFNNPKRLAENCCTKTSCNETAEFLKLTLVPLHRFLAGSTLPVDKDDYHRPDDTNGVPYPALFTSADDDDDVDYGFL